MSSTATLQHGAELSPPEVLSTIVHDLRQPLSNIEAIAYYLMLVLPKSDEKIQAHLERIRELVQQSSDILSNSVRQAGCAQPADPVQGR